MRLGLDTVAIRHELRCGDLGRIVQLHGTVYEPLDGFGIRFEAFVARTIAEYMLDNDAKGRVWLAERGAELVGCSAIALRDGRIGQLRWVLVDPSSRGLGLGRRLVETSLDYCRKAGLQSVFLETTDGLPESQTLYESLGFTVVSNELAELWAGSRTLTRMRLSLAS